MGKVIHLVSDQAKTAKTELDCERYLAGLDRLVSQADHLARQYGLETKDVLTDALCVLVELILAAQSPQA